MISNVSSAGTQGMAQMAQMRAQMFKKSDADSSGGLDIDEFKSMIANGPGQRPGSQAINAEDDFKAFDTDQDGSLTQDELDAGMKSKMESFRSTVSQFGGPGGHGGPPPGPPPDGNGDSTSTSTSTSSTDSSSSDPLQALLAALQNNEKSTSRVADQLKQLLQGLQGDSSNDSTHSSSVSVTA